MELQDYTKMTALTEEWKQAVSEQVDALWAATGYYKMNEWANEVGLHFMDLLAISEYYMPQKPGEYCGYSKDLVLTDSDWKQAVELLEHGQGFLFE